MIHARMCGNLREPATLDGFPQVPTESHEQVPEFPQVHLVIRARGSAASTRVVPGTCGNLPSGANTNPDDCPAAACKTRCYADTCTCPPCACPRCLARAARAAGNTPDLHQALKPYQDGDGRYRCPLDPCHAPLRVFAGRIIGCEHADDLTRLAGGS